MNIIKRPLSSAKWWSVLGFSASLLLGACSFAPTDTISQLPVPETFDGQEISQQDMNLLAWPSYFAAEPALLKLIDIALRENRDLRLATSKMQEIQASYRIQRSEIVPDVGLVGQGEHISLSDEDISRTYSVGVGLAAYEIDFWGRIRNGNEAALQSYLASQENVRLVKINLISETAAAYYAWLTAKRTLVLSDATLATRESSAKLMKMRFDNGISSDFDYTQSQVSVASMRATRAEAQRQLASAQNALSLLVGDFRLAGVLAEANLDRDLDYRLPFAAGLSSQVLLARPDVMAAENQLRAANANIGVARAAFFPNVRIEGSVGKVSLELDSLLDAGVGWRFVPSISLPLFGAGLYANLDLAKARKISAIAEYEKAIQQAFYEVYQYETDSRLLKSTLDADGKLFSTQQKRLKLAKHKYQEGLSSFFEVLSAEEALFQANLQQLTHQYQQIQANIYLYKALGAGTLSDNQAPSLQVPTSPQPSTPDSPNSDSHTTGSALVKPVS